MNSIKKMMFPLMLMLILGIQRTQSQTNKIEFKEKVVSTNLNFIGEITNKKEVKKKNKESKKELNVNIKTLADLERIVERKRRLRYRTNRNIPEKCYNETADSCKDK